jgi:protein-disulfide isomerase
VGANATAPASNAAPADARAAFAAAWAKQPRRDLGIPADGAKVVIVKFNDYECPTCRVAETYYGPVLEKFNREHPGAVKYVMKDWPWNSACNVGVRTTFIGHEAACAAVAAARMARDRGKFTEMETWLFANQGTTPEKVKEAAATILGVTDFDREYAQKLPEIRQDVADGMALQIHATPTFFINGIELPADRLVAPEYFELAIELELQRAE